MSTHDGFPNVTNSNQEKMKCFLISPPRNVQANWSLSLLTPRKMSYYCTKIEFLTGITLDVTAGGCESCPPIWGRIVAILFLNGKAKHKTFKTTFNWNGSLSSLTACTPIPTIKITWLSNSEFRCWISISSKYLCRILHGALTAVQALAVHREQVQPSLTKSGRIP